MGKFIRCAACILMLSGIAAADDIRKITLKTNDIIYDPVSHKIYASVPSSAGINGNCITVIDPWSGFVGPSIPVGSEPNKLALSDDGQYLYVSLDGAAAVRRVHVPTLTPGLQFVLGSDPFSGLFYVEDMEVLPGQPEAVAVSRRSGTGSPQCEGVAVYDNGVQRPNVAKDNYYGHVIEFSSSASRLYGLDNQAWWGTFYRMSVDASGVTIIDTTTNIINGDSADLEFDNGLMHFTTGAVYEPETKSLIGSFSGVGPPTIVKPDSTISRTFFLTGNEYSATRTLLAFDQGTFLPAGSLSVSDVSGAAKSLVRWGANGLAFRADDGIHLIRTVLAPLPARTLVPADVDTDGLQEIFADLGPAGLWLWDGAWTSVSALNPDSMVAADLDGNGVQELAADFGASGLWVMNAGSWTLLATANPDGLITAEIDGDTAAELVVDFDGMGAWAWDSGSWIQLSGANADSVVAADLNADGRSELIADAGAQGLWRWAGGVWTVMSALDAQGMTAAHVPGGDSVVVDFGSTGVWQWTSGAWTQLSGADPDAMIAVDTDFDGASETAADFGPLGVWLWDGAWTQLSGRDPDMLTAADTDGNGAREVIVDFGPLGLWSWNGIWSQLSGLDPSAVAEASIDADLTGELVADFGSTGIWVLDNGTWSRIR